MQYEVVYRRRDDRKQMTKEERQADTYVAMLAVFSGLAIIYGLIVLAAFTHYGAYGAALFGVVIPVAMLAIHMAADAIAKREAARADPRKET